MPTRIRLPSLALMLVARAACCAPTDEAQVRGASAAPVAASAAACPGRAASAPRDAARPTSKLRHMPDEGDPCASSIGLGQPLRRLDPASGAR